MQQSAIEVDTRICKVTLYRSGALVARRGKAGIQGRAGPIELCIRNLPLLLEEDSVRLRLNDPAAAQVEDMHLEFQLSPRQGSLDTEAEARHRALRRTIRKNAAASSKGGGNSFSIWNPGRR